MLTIQEILADSNMDRDEEGHTIYYPWFVEESMKRYAEQFIDAAAKIANSWENTDSIGNSIKEELTEQLK